LESELLRRQAEEQTKAAAQLAELNERLTDADRRKDEFLAMLGHELRTPLAPLLASLELMRQEDVDVSRLTTIMDRQLKQLIRLVDDLMDVSRITSGRVKLCCAKVELSRVLDQAVATVLPSITRREHTLSIFRPDEPVKLHCDPARMIQVVSNLLSNASRYTDVGGHIELQCSADDDELTLRVIDDGRGISEGFATRIFEPFVQESVGSGGLGVGLTLVKRLVGMHGGSVTVDSRGSGQGSCFTIRMPLRGDVADEPSEPGDVLEELSSETHSQELHIVVIEDSFDVRESMTELLRSWGHRVDAACSGEEGITLLMEGEPDVALIDIALPGLDGYDVARRVRESKRENRPKLVALTGFGRDEDRLRASEAGFDEHIVKPPLAHQLRRLLRETSQHVHD
jgi:CheY-like chemotaxis protein